MTQDEIIRMAREAGFEDYDSDWHMKRLERFAALVADHEREACAKVCEDINNPTFEAVAAAIRVRGEK